MRFLDILFPFSKNNKLKILKSQYFRKKFLLQNILRKNFYSNNFFNLFNEVKLALRNYYFEYNRTEYTRIINKIFVIRGKLDRNILKGKERKILLNYLIFLINSIDDFFTEIDNEVNFLILIHQKFNLRDEEIGISEDSIFYFCRDLKFHRNNINKLKDKYLRDILIA